MTEALAEALSEIDDPEIIAEILSAAGTGSENLEHDSLQQAQPTLSDLYQRFLKRRENRSPATRAQYKRTIPEFIQFVGQGDIKHPNLITTEIVDSFVDELQSSYDRDATVYTYTKNVRTWLNWLADRNLCEKSTCRILSKDELGLSPRARDEALPDSEATAILDKLRRRRRGTAIHATIETFWNGGPRLGGAHSCDLRDFNPETNELRFRHRPETGTRLKNGCESDDRPGDGERIIELKDEVVDALQLYINTERPDVTDEYGRRPLFATQHGRATRSTLRRWVYEATCCRWAPEDSTKPSCDGTCDPDSAICPQSYYPHAVRRGSIVSHLSGGLRPDRASGRFDVSVPVIKKHYDPRTERKRKEDREEAVRNSWSA